MGLDVIPDEEVTPEDEETVSHIEFIPYKNVSIFKIWYLKKHCIHDWYRYQRMSVNVNADGVPQQINDTLICRKCGKITKIELC